MAVVANFTKIVLEIVQCGVQYAENATSPTIGKLCAVKFPQGDKTKTEAEVKVSLWLMKSKILRCPQSTITKYHTKTSS